MRTILFAFILALAATTASAQTSCGAQSARSCQNVQTINTSGGAITIQNNAGLVPTFEYTWTGSPSAITVTLSGCGLAGTCETLDTYSSSANSLRAPSIAKVYASYTVAAAWTGSATLTVSTIITSARGASSGGGTFTLTTIGSSGAATYSGGVLNIPQYTGSGSSYPAGTGIAVVTAGAAWGTTLAAPTGTVVGTTDTQTLTNKTLDGVSPATMAFVDPTSSVQGQLNAKAPLASPALTGTPTAPTAAASTNTTQVASTAFTQAAIAALVANYCPLTGCTLTGAVTATSFTASGGPGGLVLPNSAAPSAVASSVQIIAPATITTGYNFVMPAGPLNSANPVLEQCTGTATTLSCAPASGTVSTALVTGTYSDVSFNNSHVATAHIGLEADSSGTDKNLYEDVPTGGAFDFRANSVSGIEAGVASGNYWAIEWGAAPTAAHPSIQADVSGTDPAFYLVAGSGGQVQMKSASLPLATFVPGSAPTGACSGNYFTFSAADGKGTYCNGTTQVNKF